MKIFVDFFILVRPYHFFQTSLCKNGNYWIFSLSHSVGYKNHSVGYKNHSVGYIFHSVKYKNQTVEQRIYGSVLKNI